MKTLVRFLDAHAGAIQAVAAAFTVLVALGALAGVKLQIDASERVQREQSARDIYREFLNLSITQPDLASPNYCAIIGTTREAAYENYVEYLLYTAEQTLAADDSWEPTVTAGLAKHAAFLCASDDWSSYSDDVRRMVMAFKTDGCAKIKPCPE